MRLHFVRVLFGKAVACFSDEKELERWIGEHTVYIGDLEHPVEVKGEKVYIGAFHLKNDKETELEVVPLEFGQPVYDFIWKEYGIKKGDYLAAFDTLFDSAGDASERLEKAGFRTNEDLCRD